MSRPKGLAKTGGRAAGLPNVATKERVDLVSRARELGLNPFDELVALCKSTQDPLLKLGILREIMKYCHPQLKAVEHSGQVDLSVLMRRVLNDMETKELIALAEVKK